MEGKQSCNLQCALCCVPHTRGQQSIDSARARSTFSFIHFIRSFVFFVLEKKKNNSFAASAGDDAFAEWIGAFLFAVNVQRSASVHIEFIFKRPQRHRFVHWITIVSSIYVNWRLNWNFIFVVVVGDSMRMVCDILDSNPYLFHHRPWPRLAFRRFQPDFRTLKMQ